MFYVVSASRCYNIPLSLAPDSTLDSLSLSTRPERTLFEFQFFIFYHSPALKPKTGKERDQPRSEPLPPHLTPKLPKQKLNLKQKRQITELPVISRPEKEHNTKMTNPQHQRHMGVETTGEERTLLRCAAAVRV